MNEEKERPKIDLLDLLREENMRYQNRLLLEIYPGEQLETQKKKLEKQLREIAKKHPNLISIMLELKIKSREALYSLKNYGYENALIENLQKILFK